MLEAIRGARKSITYQQYFFEDGAIAHEIAEAFAERCRASVQVKILLDSLGGGNIPKEIPELWKKPVVRWTGSSASRYFSSSRRGSY